MSHSFLNWLVHIFMDGTKFGIKHLDSCDWVIFHDFFTFPDFFSKSTFSKNSFRNTIRVSNSLAQCFVRPDLGPNCLQKLSADTRR